MNETKRTTTPFENKGNQPKWKEIAIGGTTGILLAGAGIALTSFDTHAEEPAAPADDNAADSNDAAASADTHAAASSYDDMSFADAFAAARSEMGPGGVFTWHGNTYGTYLKSEWDAMNDNERNDFADNHSSSNNSQATDNNTEPDNTETAQHEENQQQAPASQNQTAQNTQEENNGTENVGNSNDEPVAQNSTEGNDGTFDVDSEIEFVSFEQVDLMNDGTMSNVGTAIVDGQEVLLIDVDGDGGNFDLMAADFNSNGQLEDNEIVDISDQQISVEGFAQSVGTAASFDANGEGVFISDEELGLSVENDGATDTAMTDDSMPDYVNDADAGDFVVG